MLAAHGASPPVAATVAALRLARTDAARCAVDVEANDVSIDAKGATRLKGDVRVRQGNREIRPAEDVEYREQDNALKVDGNVEFVDPVVHATERRRQLFRDRRRASLRDAEFELRERAARGEAKTMQMTPDGAHHASTA